MLDLLIANAVVITVDPQRRILDPGHVGVRDGRIEVVAPGAPPPGLTAARTLDAAGGLLHPGLVDTHAHVAWGLARAAVPEQFDDDEILTCFDIPLIGGIEPEEEHLGTLLACTEMAMNGTTCFADTGSAVRELAPTAEAVEAVGIRGMIAYLNADAVDPVPALARSVDDCLARIERALAAHPLGAGRAWACAGLLGMEAVSDELVRDAKALADRAGVPLNLHKSFAAAEVDACRARSGGRDPLQAYAELGVLDPRLLLVHLNHCSAAEADLLASTRAAVAHCPTASMTYALGGSRHGRVPELLARDVAVGLGSDSTHWGNNWDLTRSLHLAATLHKEATGNRTAVIAEQALEMATIHGAAAVGRLDELGSIEVGKRADLVLHGVDRPELRPLHDPVATLVLSAGSRGVRDVFVDGEQVVAGGRPVRVDLDRLLDDAERAGRRMLERLGYRRPTPWRRVRPGVPDDHCA